MVKLSSIPRVSIARMTAAALIGYARKGYFKETDRVLFWHTGGLINLFQ